MMMLSTFLKIQCLILFCLGFIVIAIPANAQSSISYAIGEYADPTQKQYSNDLKLSKILSMPGADELDVSIIGQIEKCCQSDVVTTNCCDYLTLYDSHDEEIAKYSGDINEQFTVKGASIRVDFKSDGRTTKKGFRVKIALLFPARVFKDIKNKLLVASHLFLKLGTEEAYAKISKNRQALKALQAKMQQIPETELFIDQVAAKLMLIAQNYKEVAAMNIKAHQKQFEILKRLKKQTQYQIDQIVFKKKKYQDSLDQIANQLENIENHLEKQKMEVSMTGYKNMIPSLNAQQVIWTEFAQLQETLEAKLRFHSNNIDLFLHTLKINGQIYQEFAQAVLLRQDTISSLSQILKFPHFCDNFARIVKSEKEIRQWIKKIEQSEFTRS